MKAAVGVWLILAAVAGAAIACVRSDTAPPRPAGLPNDAVWVGGADGGVFVRLSRDGSEPDSYSGTVYYPNGEVWYQGRFVVSGADALNPRVTVADVAGWDGTQLILKSGGALVGRPD